MDHHSQGKTRFYFLRVRKYRERVVKKLPLEVHNTKAVSKVQVINYEIVVNFFHVNHNLTLYSAIVHKFTRIYPICSTYEQT